MTLTWVVQNNMYAQRGYTEIITTLDKVGCDYRDVKVVPFSHEFDPPIEVENPVIVLGTFTICQLAIQNNWTPGAYLNDNFKFSEVSKHYEMLNDDAKVVKFGNPGDLPARFFCRPDDDGKMFSGQIFTWSSFHLWRDGILATPDYPITEETQIVVASEKEIHEEYRLFVIDGKVVTGSRYKVGDSLSLSEEIPLAVLDFANRMIECWTPAEAFVLDIVTPGPKVGEINCFNCSGLYKSDFEKIVRTIEDKYR